MLQGMKRPIMDEYEIHYLEKSYYLNIKFI